MLTRCWTAYRCRQYRRCKQDMGYAANANTILTQCQLDVGQHCEVDTIDNASCITFNVMKTDCFATKQLIFTFFVRLGIFLP